MKEKMNLIGTIAVAILVTIVVIFYIQDRNKASEGHKLANERYLTCLSLRMELATKDDRDLSPAECNGALGQYQQIIQR